MDNDEFYGRLKRAIDASLKFHGCLKKAAIAGGKSEDYLDRVMAEKAEPGFFFVANLAKELGVSMNYLAGQTNEPFDISSMMSGDGMNDAALGFFDQISGKLQNAALQRGQEPTFQDVLQLWNRHNKQLSAFDSILEWFDIYEVPDASSDGLQLVRMGEKSLAAQTLSGANLSSLQYALDHVEDHTLKNNLLNAYREAGLGKPILSEEVLNVRTPSSDQKIELEYFRLLIRVECEDELALILSYSQAFR